MKRPSVFASGIQRGVSFAVALALFCWSVSPAARAQTTLKSVEFTQPNGGEVLEADFVLPQADHVSSIEASVAGKPLEKDKIKFAPADKVPNYHCAVLVVVDKTLGAGKDANDKGKLGKAVRHILSEVASVAGTGPYQFAVGTISAGSFDVLAPMGSEKSIVNSAIDKLPFNGASPELYLGTKRAVDWLAGTPAERKFLILVSDGSSQDKVASQQEVVQAAAQAKVHICTIGFPKSAAAEDVQRLGPLAEETGGYALRADGSDPKLPAGAESNLDKFMVSGGRAEIDLKGLKAPLSLACTVQTEFGKAYTFLRTVENISAAAAAEAVPAVTPAASKWVHFKERLRSHPVITVCGGIALIAAVLVFVILVGRLSAKPDLTMTRESAMMTNAVTARVSPQEDDTVRVTEPPVPVVSVPVPVPALAWLTILDADGTRLPITKPAVRIGRKPDNDIVMKNDSVSSYHAEILKRADKFVIADLDSSNKIVVSGKLVDKAPLEDGDIIELGEVRLRFTLDQTDGFAPLKETTV